MSESFDPYYTWLGIPPKDQPPHHYRLLAIELFESNPDVIENAADRQMAHVRTFQTGKHAARSQKLLNEISQAKICLLNADSKATYDAQLKMVAGENAATPPRATSDAPAAEPKRQPAPNPAPSSTPDSKPAGPAGETFSFRPQSQAPTKTTPRRKPTAWTHPGVLVGGAAAVLIVLISVLIVTMFGKDDPQQAGGQGTNQSQKGNSKGKGGKGTKGNDGKGTKDNGNQGLGNQGTQPIAGTGDPQRPGINTPETTNDLERLVQVDLGDNTSPRNPPPPAVASKVKMGVGHVTPYAAVVHTLPMADVESLTRDMEPYGYRPTRIRPYPYRDTLRAAVIWHRDHRAWRLVTNQTSMELEATHRSMKQQGFAPVDMAGYVENGQMRYLGLWTAKKKGDVPRQVVIGRNVANMKPVFDQLKSEGFWPLTIQFAFHNDQQMLSRVFVKTETKAGWHTWRGSQSYLENVTRRPSDVPTDIATATNDRNGVAYGGSLLRNKNLPAAELHGLPLMEHNNHVRRLLMQGYIPVGIGVCVLDPNEPSVASSIWQWPLGRPERVPSRLAYSPRAVNPVKVVANNPSTNNPGTNTPTNNPGTNTPTTNNPGTNTPEVDSRLKVPAADAISSAVSRVRDVFKARFAGAKTAATRSTVARDLRQQAKSEKDESLSYALYQESIRMSSLAHNHLETKTTIDELVKAYAVDPLDVRYSAIKISLANLTNDANRRATAEVAIKLADEYRDTEEYRLAEEMYNAAAGCARRVDRELQRRATSAKNLMQPQKRMWQAANTARTQLSSNPDDPAANETLGRYLAFQKREFDDGLAHLAKAANKSLADVATLDLAGAADAETKAKIGDAWYDWGNGVSGTDQQGAFNRALYWYRDGVDSLDGFKKGEVESRITALESKLAPTNSDGELTLAWLPKTTGRAYLLKGHTTDIVGLQTTQDGKQLISAARSEIKSWNLESGEEDRTLYQGTEQLQTMVLTPDDKYVFAGSRKRVGVWNLEKGAPLQDFQMPSPVQRITVSPDGSRLLWVLSSSSDNNVVIFDQKRRRLAGAVSRPMVPRTIAYGPQNLVAIADSQNIYISDVSRIATPAMTLTATNGIINEMKFSPNGRYMAACLSGEIRIWDLRTGQATQNVTDASGAYSLSFLPNGDLVTATYPFVIKVIDPNTGNIKTSVSARDGGVSSMYVRKVHTLNNSNVVFLGGDRGDIVVWRF